MSLVKLLATMNVEFPYVGMFMLLSNQGQCKMKTIYCSKITDVIVVPETLGMTKISKGEGKIPSKNVHSVTERISFKHIDILYVSLKRVILGKEVMEAIEMISIPFI